jgi:hypothetical protein
MASISFTALVTRQPPSWADCRASAAGAVSLSGSFCGLADGVCDLLGGGGGLLQASRGVLGAGAEVQVATGHLGCRTRDQVGPLAQARDDLAELLGHARQGGGQGARGSRVAGLNTQIAARDARHPLAQILGFATQFTPDRTDHQARRQGQHAQDRHARAQQHHSAARNTRRCGFLGTGHVGLGQLPQACDLLFKRRLGQHQALHGITCVSACGHGGGGLERRWQVALQRDRQGFGVAGAAGPGPQVCTSSCTALASARASSTFEASPSDAAD